MVMKAGRYATSRQKNCQRCSAAKAKCDRKIQGCSRCVSKRLPCVYPQTSATQDHGDTSETTFSSPMSTTDTRFSPSRLPLTPNDELLEGANTFNEPTRLTPSMDSSNLIITSATVDSIASSSLNSHANSNPQPSPTKSPAVAFSNLDLICPINPDDIKNRWLNSYIPDPRQKIKAYPRGVTLFIHRILKSYTSMTVQGRGIPPFVHSLQMTDVTSRTPLSTCLSLVRICEKPFPDSERVAAEVLEREMSSLYDEHGTYDGMTLLAAFQAYLIYSMVLFFKLSQGSQSFLRQAMMNLQDLASSSSKCGLVCGAECRRERPQWEAWIAAEAKRRTLFTMYLFDSLLLAEDGLPTYLGIELRGLPAPSSKTLWQANFRRDWETTYNVHLTGWPEDDFRIDELWPAPEGLDEQGLEERSRRVDKWVERVDEFGTMMYAVTTCTHGG